MLKNDVEKVNEGANEESLIGQKLSTFEHQEIGAYFAYQTLWKLTQTSKEMFFYYKRLAKKATAKALSSHVLRGEEAEALKMIAAKPKLLLRPSEASDYSGRTYKRFTAFQLALLCHDVTLWKKMEPYFAKLPNGQAEKKKQFKAIFPAGVLQQEPYDFNPLIEAISASPADEIEAVLEKESNDTTICKALEAFRKTFTDLAMKEMFFNLSHLIKAFKVYDEQFDTWLWSQRDLFWRQVIGYIQRFLPACYAQAFCQGLYYIIEKENLLRRSLKYHYGDRSYYPLRDSSGLGFDFAIWCGRVRGCALPPDAPTVGGTGGWLINYVDQIRQNYLDLNIACGMTDNPSRAATI